jgi:hypothetical protein
MSWGINYTGTLAGVKAKLATDLSHGNIPQFIADAINAVIDDTAANNPSNTGVSVESWGHLGGGSSSVGKLEIQPLYLFVDQPAATVAPAPVVTSDIPVAPVTDGNPPVAPVVAAPAPDAPPVPGSPTVVTGTAL